MLSNASFGAFINDATPGANVTKTTVKMIAITANIEIPLPTTSPASFFFPWPSFWPINIVIPIASPVTVRVITCINWLPVETAETSAAWPNLPTTSKSTAPYIVCKNNAANIGMMNVTRGEKIFPCVKSLTFDIYVPSFPNFNIVIFIDLYKVYINIDRFISI